MKQEVLRIRRMRKDEGSDLGLEIVMSEPIESAEEREVIWQENMRTILVEIRQNEKV